MKLRVRDVAPAKVDKCY